MMGGIKVLIMWDNQYISILEFETLESDLWALGLVFLESMVL